MHSRDIGAFRRHLMGFCLGTFAVIGYIAIIAPKTPAKISPTMAFVQCKDFVKDRLKSPATAEFPTLDFEVLPRGENTYAIRSYVDSQNSYGAKIRANFFCEVEWNGKDEAVQENWELRQLELKERG
jgi:hypothetical protein